jgi:hypothetical protein
MMITGLVFLFSNSIAAAATARQVTCVRRGPA